MQKVLGNLRAWTPNLFLKGFIHSPMHAFISKMNLYGGELYAKHNATPWACSDSVINNNNSYILLSAYYVSGIGLSHLHLSTASLHTTGEYNYIGTNSHIYCSRTY